MGFAWSIIRPLINILIFGCLSLLINRDQSVGDQFLMVSAGVVIWQLISTSISDTSNALLSNANILTKVYFPKLLLPLSGLLVCLVDFLIAFVLFFLAFLIIKGLPSPAILLMPLVLLYALFFSFALGLIFATASVKYRDVKFIIPFLLQLLFYASPVFLSTSYILSLNIPDALKLIYQLNPLLQVINAFRFCFYGTYECFNAWYLLGSVLFSVVLCYASLRYFFRFETSFADHI